MAAKTKVQVRLDFLKILQTNFFTPDFVRSVGETVTDGILDATAKGLSPVKGFGRFDGYKAQEQAKELRKKASKLSNSRIVATESSERRRRDKASSIRAKASSTAEHGYPLSVQDDFPDKKVRPVNLRLSGKMLGSIRFQFNKAKNSIRFFLVGRKQNLMAETHNEGTQDPKVARRPFLPTGNGEEFISSITRDIIGLYRSKIESIIEMSKKKR